MFVIYIANVVECLQLKVTTVTFQPSLWASPYLVVQTSIVWKVADAQCVNVVPGLRVLDTSVQVAFCFLLLFLSPHKMGQNQNWLKCVAFIEVLRMKF